MKDPALKWWHVRWRLAGRRISRFAIVSGKIVGLFCVLAAVAGGVLYLIQPWFFSQHVGKSDPQLRITPISLSATSQAPLSDLRVDRDGISFRLPNGAEAGARTYRESTLMRFPNGMMQFLGPLRDEDSIVVKLVRDNKDAEKLLNQETIKSQFKLLQAAMLATPDQVKWWRFRSTQNKRGELLLLLKFVALLGYSPVHGSSIRPLYMITSAGFRGFQLGDPDKPPYDTHIDLFDSTSRHFAFDISGLEGHGQVLTQGEINAILASIRLASGH